MILKFNSHQSCPHPSKPNRVSKLIQEASATEHTQGLLLLCEAMRQESSDLPGKEKLRPKGFCLDKGQGNGGKKLDSRSK